jgi:guanosine-3',5'-bis(diphosphate) 3'-pyrophosphohydrolase
MVTTEQIISLEEILDEFRSYFPTGNTELIERAFNYARDAHKDQLRSSGEEYFVHSYEVAKILTSLHLDPSTIAAGLLHDVVEDTGITIDDLGEAFGDDIASLVDGMTKISELQFKNQEEKQAENFRKMLLSMSKDIRVILIKFADRLHNMRTIEYLPVRTQKRIAIETRDVYAPLAHRMGIARIKWELEDLSFKVLHPKEYRTLVQKVSLRREDRERLIEQTIIPIRQEMDRIEIRGKVFGRAKHLYSIYSKMQSQGKSFEEIYDLLGIRIIVDRVEDCYYVLGLVHSLYKPLMDKFSDYIAVPKSNMYRSLHTKVIGPEGRLVEVQIRTKEMDDTAEVGIAAHWQYKEGIAKPDELDLQMRWLRQILEGESETLSSTEFMETLKINLFPDEIFVFTPKGKLITLPLMATPVDFAYAIHSDVGHHALAAKVNGKIVPLSHKLSSGNVVEIITSGNQRPNAGWLKYVRTARARQRIKRYLKEAQYEDSVRIGKEMLSRELQKLRVKSVEQTAKLLAETYGYGEVDGLYAALGSGDIALQHVLRKLTPEESRQPVLSGLLHRMKKGRDGSVRIHGLKNVMVHFAECCQPLPGDPIIGFTTRGKGITIHRTDCRNLESLLNEPKRIVSVEWDADRDVHFNVRIHLVGEDRKNLLHDITEVIAPLDVNIIYIDMKAEDTVVSGRLILEVKSLAHLTRILKRIRNVKGVIEVRRLDEESVD